MTEMMAETDAIRRCAGTYATMTGDVMAAAGTNQAATVGAVVPVFGLIGQDFLAAFAGAQANNLLSTAELAAVYAMMALTGYQGATGYDLSDGSSAIDIGAIGKA